MTMMHAPPARFPPLPVAVFLLAQVNEERNMSMQLRRQTEIILAATLLHCRQAQRGAAAGQGQAPVAQELETILSAALVHVRNHLVQQRGGSAQEGAAGDEDRRQVARVPRGDPCTCGGASLCPQ